VKWARRLSTIDESVRFTKLSAGQSALSSTQRQLESSEDARIQATSQMRIVTGM
jgi:hypothetical protein